MPFHLILNEIFKTTPPSATLRGSAFYFHPWRLHILTWEKKIHSNKFINLPARPSIHIYVVFIIYINCRLTVSPCSSVFKYTNTNTQIQIHKYKSRITSIQIHKSKYKCIKSYTRSAHLLSMLRRAMHLRLTFNRRLFLRQGGCVRHKPKLATLSCQIFLQSYKM